MMMLQGCRTPSYKINKQVSLRPPVNIEGQRTVSVTPAKARGSNADAAQALGLSLERMLRSKNITIDLIEDGDKVTNIKISPEIIVAQYFQEQFYTSGETRTYDTSGHSTRGGYNEREYYKANYQLSVRYNIYDEGMNRVWAPVIETEIYRNSAKSNISPHSMMDAAISRNIQKLKTLFEPLDSNFGYNIALVDDTTKSLVPLLEKGDYQTALETLKPAWNKYRKSPKVMFSTNTKSAMWQTNMGILNELSGDYSRAMEFYAAAYKTLKNSLYFKQFNTLINRCFLQSQGNATVPSGFR
jgi:hypothetical protein